MLIEKDRYIYMYPITRDYGFAPNPFNGYCTLATCKPRIRKHAKVGDYIIGIGGCNFTDQRKQCVFIMQVTEKLSFNEYWNDRRFLSKKPVRNGSRLRMVGDNIYHKNDRDEWIQENSHHSNSDGSPNKENLRRDTNSTDQVLISDRFIYFGKESQYIDLNKLGYSKVRDYKKLDLNIRKVKNEINKLVEAHKNEKNKIISSPIDFRNAHKRVNQKDGRVY